MANRTKIRRYTRQAKGYGVLTPARMQYLFAGFDLYDHLNSCWHDDSEIRECWELHKEEVLQEWQRDICNTAKRPWAWWWFNHGCKAPVSLAGSPREAQALLQMGELQPWEIEKFNEWNEPLINKNNIAASVPADGKGDNNRAEQS